MPTLEFEINPPKHPTVAQRVESPPADIKKFRRLSDSAERLSNEDLGMLKVNLCAGTGAEENCDNSYENEPPNDLPLQSVRTLAQMRAGFNRNIGEERDP